jgi:hypothetical protein
VSNRISRTHTPTSRTSQEHSQTLSIVKFIIRAFAGLFKPENELAGAHWLNRRCGFAARTYVPPFKAEAETHSA